MQIEFPVQLPPENYQRIVKELSYLIPDSALKFKFLREAINERYDIPAPYKFYPPLAEGVYRKVLLDKIEAILPGTQKRAKKLIRQGVISSPRTMSWFLYKFRHLTAIMLVTFLVCGFGISMASLIEGLDYAAIKNTLRERLTTNTENTAKKVTKKRIPNEDFPKYLKEPIWLVERKQNSEIYSNRLNIITAHTVKNIPRSYFRVPRNPNPLPSHPRLTSKIAGILYHSTESDIFPFIPAMNKSIKRYSKALIRYLKKKKSYHYFIDRFGRVYRLVQDDHAAYHAGRSIWADEENVYLKLNHAFIGISFEGKDFEKIEDVKPSENQKPGFSIAQIKPMDHSSINEAQLRSGKELTDWLRAKYNIPQNNCVPHALASVNSKKMLIGHHLDLSYGFPFNQFGLTDKYKEPLPSIVEFGFAYDSYFEEIFDNKIWPGIHYAEKLLAERARENRMNSFSYRRKLREKYARYMKWLNTHNKETVNVLTKRTS